MSKQALVIGLGQFGMSLARALARHGSEVIAVDLNPQHIHDIAPHVVDAILMDAMDEEALTSLAPGKRDVCICAIGDENREASIIVTALLKQLGAPSIIARTTDALHSRILRLVGADEVISPERDYGDRLAVRLSWHHIVNIMPLGGDLVLTEIQVPESFWGRTLAELDLPSRFRVTVCAIRHQTRDGIVATIPNAHQPLRQDDILMLVSREDDARQLTERV